MCMKCTAIDQYAHDIDSWNEQELINIHEIAEYAWNQ